MTGYDLCSHHAGGFGSDPCFACQIEHLDTMNWYLRDLNETLEHMSIAMDHIANYLESIAYHRGD